MNITEYVKKMKYTFDEVPFNPVDSLVLSQMSYCRIEFALPKNRRVLDWLHAGYTVKDFFRNECFEDMFFDGITDDLNMELMAYVSASRRFRDLKIRDIVGDMDSDIEKQFGAMIFQLDSETDFVAFRGTDGSMMGWKEDFNLSYMDEVPSQTAAVEYIERNYGNSNFTGRKRRIIVGGHSKGGNLAVYGALMCDPAIHDRILGVYSLDGPGFRDEIQEKLDAIEETSHIPMVKLVPQSSVVGMLMQNNDRYSVVQSDAMGIMQHMAYTWKLYLLEDGEANFIYLDKIDAGGRYLNRTVREWLTGLDDEKRQHFINSLFGVLEENGIETLNDLKALSLPETVRMVTSIRSLDEEDRKVIVEVLKSLAGAALPKISNPLEASLPKIPKISVFGKDKENEENEEEEEK